MSCFLRSEGNVFNFNMRFAINYIQLWKLVIMNKFHSFLFYILRVYDYGAGLNS